MSDITWTACVVRLGDLRPWERNPKTISKSHAKRLINYWQRIGQFQTIAIGPGGEVYDGHQRLSCLLSVYGADYEVQALRSSRALTDEERRELVIAAHVGTTGQFNWDELANWDAAELQDWGLDGEALQDWRTGIGALTELIEAAKPEPAEDAGAQIDKAEELREKWGVESGQMWQLGEHRLICGDCTDKAVVERVMGGEKAQTLFTSPPYNMAGGLYQNYADNLKSAKYIEFNLSVVQNWIPHLRGYLFWNISYNKNSRWEFLEILSEIIKKSGLRFLELIVWDKGHGMPIVSRDMLTRSYEDILLMADEETTVQDLEWVGLFGTERKAYFNKKTGKGITNYWKIGTNKSQNDDLLACFPVQLPEKGISLTTVRGDVIAEPFCGSGTTIIACERLGRKCRAVEISPAYVAVAIQRWVDMTGGVPELITDEQ